MTGESDDVERSDPERDGGGNGADSGGTEAHDEVTDGLPAGDDPPTPGTPGTEPTRDGVSGFGEREIGESLTFSRSDRPLEPYHFTHEEPHPDDPREYGPVRRFARERPGRFRALQRWLDQAGFGTSYDRYAVRCVQTGTVGAVVGLLLGVLAAVALAGGSLGGGAGGGALLGGGAVGPLVAAVGSAVAGAVLGAVCGFGGRLLHPLAVARHRARRVRVGLPHAIIFLYALSHGGVNIYESAHRLADAEETYGPIAGEFRRIVQDTRLFDRDLFAALVSARRLTPADRFAVFLDELVNVLETGGDVGAFLQSEAESNLEAAQERQEELLNDMDTLAEVYIVFIFAGPVFLLVVLLVVSFISTGVVTAMRALVYVVVPLAIVGFLAVFWWLMEPYLEHVGAPNAGGSVAWTDTDGAEPAPDDPRLDAYRDQRSSLFGRFAAGPVTTLRDRPVLVLYATVPLGLIVALATWLTVPSSDPIRSGIGTIAVPFLLSAIPYGGLYELNRRRQRDVRKRFPDALETVAEGVDNDVPLSDCFALVAERTGGTLAEELHRAHRDVGWTNDIAGALARFADRIGVPQVTRTVRLLEESVRATDDLGPIFRLVAEDLDRRNTIRRERRQQMQPYIIIVFLGVVVYLAIVVMFDTFFLPVVAERAAAATTVEGSSLQIDPAPLSTYRRLFFHSALIQAIGNGFLLGKLTDNRLRSGVAYASILVVIVLVTFLLFV